MAGVDFGSLPPGAREDWLNEGDRRAHDSLYTGDIVGAKPGLLSVFVSKRQHNDPLDPQYKLPAVPAPTNPNLHARTQMPLGGAHSRHEVADINAKRVSAFSCMSKTPARDIMRTNDIIGGGRRQNKAIDKGYDSMQVQDINHDGVFKSSRSGANPLEPTYNYDPLTHQEWRIPGAKPRGFRNLSDNPDLKLKSRDILGCCPDDLTKVTRTVKTRQVLRTDDIDAAQANTVMHAMRTTRCTNPLDPVYVPLQSESDIAPAFPNMYKPPPQLPPSIKSHRNEMAPKIATPKTPGTIQKENQKRTKELTKMMQERLDQKGGRMRNQFVKFDANHDGTINHEEFRSGLLEGLGMPIKTPDVDLLIKNVDSDNSGRIDYIEFSEKMKVADETTYLSLGEKSKEPFRIKTPRAAADDMTEDERVDRSLDVKLHYAVQQKCSNIISEFRKFDEDGDSMLSRSELKRGLERVGVQFSDEEFKRLVLRMDNDDTGFVDYSEFMRHMEAPENLEKASHSKGTLIHNKAFHEAQRQKVPHMLSTAQKRDRDLIMTIREKADQRSSNARKLMAKFDDDGSGQLDYPEFRRGLEMGLNMPMKDEEFERIVTLFDPDGSGQIDYLEFSECIKGKEFGKEEIYFKKKEDKVPSKPNSSGGRISGRVSGRVSGQSTPKATRLARAKEREERQREIDSIANLPDELPQGKLDLSKVKS